MRRSSTLIFYSVLLVLGGCSTGAIWGVDPAETHQESTSRSRMRRHNTHSGGQQPDDESLNGGSLNGGTENGNVEEVEDGSGFPPVELVENPDADRFVDQYSKRARRTLQEALDRRRAHLPVVAEEFDRVGIPLELSNIAIIESGFNQFSRGKGTVGMWQFTAQTARHYGLKISKDRDERTDVRRSSAAAARLLSDLYDIYGDWYLVLAAYNCGRARLDRGIRDTGYRDYFQIKDRRGLSKTTGDFVPRFIAITSIMRDPGKFGFTL